jgi:putative ABC transport system ATP-binding protein
MIFQAFNLLPHQTALRNVELPLYFTDTPKRERRKLAIEALERLGLADRLDHRPGDLSGGEQQRVAVARALVKRPRILLADEPTGNLDRENSRELAELLCGLNREGLTLIIVTHDLNIASRTASRMLRMDYGRIVGDSTSEEDGD